MAHSTEMFLYRFKQGLTQENFEHQDEDSDEEELDVEEKTLVDTVSEVSSDMRSSPLPPEIECARRLKLMNYLSPPEDEFENREFLTGPWEDPRNGESEYAQGHKYLTAVGRTGAPPGSCATPYEINSAEAMEAANYATECSGVGARHLSSLTPSNMESMLNGANILRPPTRRSRMISSTSPPPQFDYSAAQNLSFSSPTHSPSPPNATDISFQRHVPPRLDYNTYAARLMLPGVPHPQHFPAPTYPTDIQVKFDAAKPWDHSRPSIFSYTDNNVIVLPPIQSVSAATQAPVDHTFAEFKY